MKYHSENVLKKINQITVTMKKMNREKWLILALIFTTSYISAQNKQWITYNITNSSIPSNRVNALALYPSGRILIGTDSGLAQFDGKTWNTQTSIYSGLPSTFVTSLAIENSSSGPIEWVGTDAGLASEQLLTFNSKNSNIPDDYIRAIAYDNYGTKWLGTRYGVVSVTGMRSVTSMTTYLSNYFVTSIAVEANKTTKWIGTLDKGLIQMWGSLNYTNTYNSTFGGGLPDNYVRCVVIDSYNNKWIGTNNGLAKFDGSKWTNYNTSNSQIPNNTILSMSLDVNNSIWVGTLSGLAKFDGTTWKAFNTTNSSLPSNYISSLMIDNNGTKWIGTDSGLVAYNESGLANGVNSLSEQNLKVYGSNLKVVIEGDASKYAIDIYTINGEKIKSLYFNGGKEMIVLDQKGVYLIKHFNQVFKIII